jgi:type I restriction enzyme M protein
MPAPTLQSTFSELANFIWSVADILRGDYKAHQYGTLILPFVVLRRLECVLDATRDDVRAEYLKRKDSGVNLEPFLTRKSGQSFFCVSEFTLPSLLADQRHVRQNLISYIGDFSDDARDVFEQFEFIKELGGARTREFDFLRVGQKCGQRQQRARGRKARHECILRERDARA